jgi:hypothetical protein
VQRVTGVHAVCGRPGVLVAEESGPHAVQVGQPRGRRALAQGGEHGRRYVHRRHVPEPARRRDRELPGARADVHHDGRGVQPVRLEGGQVRGRIGISLLAVVTRHERRVEVFRSRVRQFVDHP